MVPRVVSPICRSFGAFAAVIALGILVAALIEGLAYVAFGPWRYVVEFDNRLYERLVPPSPVFPTTANPDPHTVVFIYIDDAAMQERNLPPGRSTSRALLADALKRVRDAGPAVVLLDMDLREPLPDDEELAKELVRPNRPPILLPHLLYGNVPSCSGQIGMPSTHYPIALPTAFDEQIGGAPIIAVHVKTEPGAYGMITGVCSRYRLREIADDACAELPSAALMAVLIANGKHDVPCTEEAAPQLTPLNWRVRAKDLLPRAEQHIPYVGMPVGRLAKSGIGLSFIRNSIVIIGSTHTGSDDVRLTPVGEMPGGLVHANMILELQADPVKEMPLVAQASLELLQLIATAALVAFFCWYRIYQKLAPEAQPKLSVRLRLVVKEFMLALAVALSFHGILWMIGNRFGETKYAWQFAGLGLLVGMVLVALIEAFSAISEAIARFAEDLAVRFTQRPAKPRKRPYTHYSSLRHITLTLIKAVKFPLARPREGTMRVFKIIVVMVGVATGLIILFLHPAFAQSDACPAEKWAGSIDRIEGSADAVVLMRQDQRIPARAGICILYGDRLDAGQVDLVVVDIDNGTRRFGRRADALGWNVPYPGRVMDPSIASTLNKFFLGISEPMRNPVGQAIGRGDCAADPATTAEPEPPLAALTVVPQVQQRVGVDLDGLTAAWTPISRKRRVTAVLKRTDGTIVVEVSGCALSSITLSLEAKPLKPGDRLLLEVRDAQGAKLQWPIEAIMPNKLPQPSGQVRAPWELVAWRLASDPEDVGLDSITRLLKEQNRSLAARRMLSVVLSDQHP